jgi:hypothetical protein
LVGVLLTRAISAVTAVLLAHLLFAPIALADPSIALPGHIDRPELYVLPAPARKNIEIVVSFRTPVSDDDLQSWSDWLRDQGFRIGDTGNGWMDVYVNIEDAESAFQTKIMMTREGTYANSTDAKIPARFANVVQSISGLSEVFLGHEGPIRARPMPTPQPHSRVSPSSDLPMKSGRLERSVFQSAYGGAP